MFLPILSFVAKEMIFVCVEHVTENDLVCIKALFLFNMLLRLLSFTIIMMVLEKNRKITLKLSSNKDFIRRGIIPVCKFAAKIRTEG